LKRWTYWHHDKDVGQTERTALDEADRHEKYGIVRIALEYLDFWIILIRCSLISLEKKVEIKGRREIQNKSYFNVGDIVMRVIFAVC
jgi:hypothetical protein